jgi:hypothetical protein
MNNALLTSLCFVLACSSSKSDDTATSTMDTSNNNNNPTDTADSSDTGVVSLSSISEGDIIITEILNNPCVIGPDTNGDGNDDCVVSDENGEWFEIYNKSDVSIDLFGLVVKDGDPNNPQQFRIDDENEHIIAPNDYFLFVVSSDPSLNGGNEPSNSLYQYNGDSNSGFSLGNSSDEIILMNAEEFIIDEVWFDDGTFPDDKGHSMNLNIDSYDSVSNDSADNWCPAQSPFGDGDFGTPLADNSSCN